MAVRDAIRYDPYTATADDPQDYRASTVIVRRVGYCVPKAVVLTAAARSLGIPARLGFADVRNHLQSRRLAEVMGSDVFVFHGFSELYVQGGSAEGDASVQRVGRCAPASASRRSTSTAPAMPSCIPSAAMGDTTWNTFVTGACTPTCPST